jgi:hypothetical protein
MAEIRCPMCSKPNPADLEVCQYCGARLKPLMPGSNNSSQPIRPGEQPVIKGTGELDRAKLGDVGPIRPGEPPTNKKTSDLEKALPSWLRSLREDQGDTLPPEEDNSIFTSAPETPDSGGAGDWLSGLDKAAASEDEAVPDWLAGLREEKPAATEPGFESEAGSDLGNADWMSRLDTPQTPASFDSGTSPTPVEESPAWLKSLQSSGSGPVEPAPGQEKPPEWHSGRPDFSAENTQDELPASTASQSFEASREAVPNESLPDWLNQLQEKGAEGEPPVSAGPPSQPTFGEDVPDWLSQLPATSAEAEGPAGTGPGKDASTPDWLSSLEEKGLEPEAPSPGGGEEVPDWLTNMEAPADATASAQPLPDWLSSLDSAPGAGPDVPALTPEEAPSSPSLPEETPAWLSQLQAESIPLEEAGASTPALDMGQVAETPAVPNDSVPGWLSGIETPTPKGEGAPAFVEESPVIPPADTGEKAFSMETPDWLSKLKPEETTEKPALVEDEGASADSIEAGALPTWVQAMRPVESVMDQARTAAPDENQVIEQSGPLAGLVGVLPAGPGLGMSRKPPAYTVKLQVSNTQQQYISNLEKLVTSETRASAVKGERQQSSRLMRWVVSAVLLAAVILPFLFPQAKMTPAPTLVPSDRNAAQALIEGLPADAPVLVGFDYSPALSGELEAVAAPLIDQLQSRGARLTLVSTSATGPALAERFMRSVLLVNSHQYKAGEQYVNLGYLPGGPAGLSFFASAPAGAMPVTSIGQAAWSLAPLQGVSQLSDFAAVLVLTDDADTGRAWIEQTGRSLGTTPMLMVISAQAEPMMQPYFDSGQLKALVSGLPDGKKYEGSFNRPGLADHYWDSFSLAGLLAGLIIIAGAAWSALLAWRDLLHKPKVKA